MRRPSRARANETEYRKNAVAQVRAMTAADSEMTNRRRVRADDNYTHECISAMVENAF